MLYFFTQLFSEASKYHISGQLSSCFWYILIRTHAFGRVALVNAWRMKIHAVYAERRVGREVIAKLSHSFSPSLFYFLGILFIYLEVHSEELGLAGKIVTYLRVYCIRSIDCDPSWSFFCIGGCRICPVTLFQICPTVSQLPKFYICYCILRSHRY